MYTLIHQINLNYSFATAGSTTSNGDRNFVVQSLTENQGMLMLLESEWSSPKFEGLFRYFIAKTSSAVTNSAFLPALPEQNDCTASFAWSQKAENRLTFLACVNGDGSEKLPLIFIGQSLRPRVFKKKSGWSQDLIIIPARKLG